MVAPDYLTLSDAALLAQCQVDTYRASGPGGQKRNKTESAVRLRHGPSGLKAHSDDSRSQHENRARALRRLRRVLALELRSELELQGYVPGASLLALFGASAPSPRNPAWLVAVRELLNLFAAKGASVRDTAEVLSVSSGALSRVLSREPALLTAANRLREQQGLKRLRG